MANTVNHQKELEKIVASLKGRPKLLLHSCCAPCSSYCLIYLLPYFDITCFYYNPNITDRDEYAKRVAELKRLADIINGEYAHTGAPPVKVIEGRYEPERFTDSVLRGALEDCPEGGRRCEMCFSMRLKETYDFARERGFEYFTTTLTISPLKSAAMINSIGYAVAAAGGPLWLPSDFKKNDGFKRSIELSEKYDLYRQDYCGCVYSQRKDK